MTMADGDIEMIYACPLCDASGDQAFVTNDMRGGVPGSFRYFSCQFCGVYWLANRFTRERINRAYPQGSYYSYREPPPPPDDWVQRALMSRYGSHASPLMRVIGKVIQAYPPAGQPGHVLDVGCGTGSRLHRLVKTGWTCAGVEPNEEAVASARKHGLDVRQGTAEDIPFEDGVFDVVILAHSIEHCHDPRLALHEAHRVLRSGGRLVLTTPNTGSAARAIWKAYWIHWDPPRHLVIFNRTPLAGLLHAQGFVVEKMRGTASGAGWVESFMLRFKRPRSARMIALVRAAAAGFALITNWLPWSDEMEAIARKPGR